MNKKLIARTTAALTALGVALPAQATEEEAAVLDKIMVVGNPANVEDMPGSAQVVTAEDIRRQNTDDVNRVLRQVPGVYVREEDGFGLFPNISLRGVDTTRSAKVTVMEDGVLTAPAPYSAPAAYYAPTIGRMSGIEVLKGSSQIKYGPQTTGGVINYLSTPIPLKETVYLKSSAGTYDASGQFSDLRTHAYYGNTYRTRAGQFGLLVEGYARQNNGYKRIDQTPDFRAVDDTGFRKTDPMIKLSWEPDSEIYQRLEFKYGRSKLDADETYLGLSEADFAANPYRRYSGSRFDNMRSNQTRSYLRYAVSPSDDFDIIATLYNNDFERNWYKLKDLRNVNGSKVGLASALAQGGDALACAKGELACTLRVRANNRSYNTRGIDTVAYYRFGDDALRHEVSAGVRYNIDKVRRFQWDDDYTQAANGTLTGMSPGAPGDAGNRLQKTRALAIFVQDTIEAGPWSLVPGVRYETLDQTYEDYAKPSKSGSNTLNMFAGGLGVAYEIDDNWTGFGGVYRGFSPPSPSGAVKSGLKEETSLSLEAGARYANRRQALAAEATAFVTTFNDLIVIDNVGGTGTGNDENFGKVRSAGLELAAQYDAGIANGWSLRNPWYISLTYTNATQLNDAKSTDAESIFSYGKKGNKVPYIPDLAFSLGTGIETADWGAYVSTSYVGETFASAANTSGQTTPAGTPDARYGKTDSYFVADASAFYRASKSVKLFAGAQNLFDSSYNVSRQPAGPRPGMPRFVYAGIELTM